MIKRKETILSWASRVLTWLHSHPKSSEKQISLERQDGLATVEVPTVLLSLSFFQIIPTLGHEILNTSKISIPEIFLVLYICTYSHTDTFSKILGDKWKQENISKGQTDRPTYKSRTETASYHCVKECQRLFILDSSFSSESYNHWTDLDRMRKK